MPICTSLWSGFCLSCIPGCHGHKICVIHETPSVPLSQRLWLPTGYFTTRFLSWRHDFRFTERHSIRCDHAAGRLVLWCLQNDLNALLQFKAAGVKMMGDAMWSSAHDWEYSYDIHVSVVLVTSLLCVVYVVTLFHFIQFFNYWLWLSTTIMFGLGHMFNILLISDMLWFYFVYVLCWIRISSDPQMLFLCCTQYFDSCAIGPLLWMATF